MTVDAEMLYFSTKLFIEIIDSVSDAEAEQSEVGFPLDFPYHNESDQSNNKWFGLVSCMSFLRCYISAVSTGVDGHKWKYS